MSSTVIHVDASKVHRLVEAFEAAISPSSLVMFLNDDAHDYFSKQIELRFAYEGDKKSGAWSELSDATQAIRSANNYPPESPINMRTGRLEDFVVTQFDISASLLGAELKIPGDAPSGELEEKLRHAQVGSAVGENPLFPNSSTPERPVLATDTADLAAMVKLLEIHIMRIVNLRVV